MQAATPGAGPQVRMNNQRGFRAGLVNKLVLLLTRQIDVGGGRRDREVPATPELGARSGCSTMVI